MNLYQINSALNEKMNKLGELLNNGETPSQEQLDELVDLQGELSEKLTAYGYVVKNLTGELDMVDTEIKRLTAVKKARQNHIAILKDRMLSAMIDNGVKKIDFDPVMPLRVRNNAPSVAIKCDIDDLPEEFVRIKKEADKTALSKALKANTVIDGVELEHSSSILIG